MLAKRLDRSLTLYLPLLFIMVFLLFPFYWTLITSFKVDQDILSKAVHYWPEPFIWDNYGVAWKAVGFQVFFQNSLIVSCISMVVTVILAMLSGYAISRFKFAGKKAFLLMLLCTQFIPGAMLLIPLFLIFRSLGLTSNLTSLIITYTTSQLPFNSILMSGFVTNIPEQLEEAAMVDGCSRFKSVLFIIFPLLLPGIVATMVFAFIHSWNEFLFALMFINKPALFTIPVGLRYMQGEFDINYGALAAGCTISLLPAVLLFAYVQRFLVQGLSSGAVKG